MKKIKPDRPDVDVRFSNWFAQFCALIMPQNLTAVVGRGGSKTTDIQVERLQEMVWDMPGAPVALVSDTYMNLQKNILPTLLEGLKMRGWVEDLHYVIEKTPPESFDEPYNIIPSYKHTIIFFNGFNLTLVSLDRPSAAAGRSYVAIIGDEVKFFPEHKISKLTKAVRGYKVKYGNSVFYRSHTFTTDMPNINNVGEHDWVLKMRKEMNVPDIVKALQAGFVYNEVKGEYINALDTGDKNQIENAEKKMKRWEERWIKTRKGLSLFFIASSFVNVDILGNEYFLSEFKMALEDVQQAIFSMKPTLDSGTKFYPLLAEKHFYKDGNNPYWSEQFGIKDNEDCRILKHLDKSKALDAGVDFGNMLSLVIGQEGKNNNYRCLKSFYTIPKKYIRELADEFIHYFQYQDEKVLNMYYDRAANNYQKVKQDLASKLKNAIEKDNNEKPTGWKVILMSVGQGNIESHVEYDFMIELMSGKHPKLPKLQIDMFNCKELKSSLEKSPVKITTIRGKKVIAKDKKSEGLPAHKLPMESTNLSDAFKYLICRKQWLKLVRGLRRTSTGTMSIR
jgi:hypothetical protein